MSTLDKWKMIYGYSLLGILGILAGMFGWGHVQEQTSHGLMPIITALATLAGAFSGWAFREKRTEDNEKAVPPEKTNEH